MASLDHPLLNDLLGQVQDIVSVVTESGTISYVSPAVKRVAGHDSEALVGTSLFALVHPDDRERVATGFSALLNGDRESVHPISHRLLTASDQWRWVETTGRDQTDTDLEGYLLTTRDLVTESELFELLTEASPDLLYFKDTDHRLVHVGRSFAAVLDAEPAALVGKRTEELWPEPVAKAVMACEQRALDGEKILDRERKLTHADGTDHWYSVNKIPRYDDAGNVIGFFAIDRDITERKAKETQLQRYKQAVQGSTDMLAASNREQEFLFANDRYREFHDIPANEDLKGRNNEAVIGETAFEQVEPHLEEVYDGNRVSFEMTRQNQAGEDRRLDVRFYPLREAEGSIVGDVTAIRDITERTENERELAEKTERLDLAIEGANLGIWDWNMQTDDVTRNEEWARMLGYEPAEVADRFGDWESLVHPDDRHPHDTALQQHIDGAESLYTVDYRLKTAAGEWKWVRNIGKVVDWGENGTPIRSVGIHQDIDEQKRAEKALKESRKRLRKIIDLVPDPIFVKNRAGEYLLVNEALAAMFGRSVEEMVGKTEAELGMSEERFEVYRKEDRKVIESGESMTISKRNATTADGESLTLQTVLIPYEPVVSDSEGVLGYARNITERTEYESQIEVQRDTLEILNQMVRHDIRNDLQVVVSYTELLKDQTGPENTTLARTVLDAARDAVEITETARDVADVVLESETEMEPQSLKGVLGEEVDRTRSKYDSARVALPESIPEVSILVDGMAESLFRNLLQNAIVHNDTSAPEVTVSATARDERVKIEVADNGPGITEERKPKIFEKGAKGLESEGTGLGLYLVRTLVDRYDGQLQIEDNEPEGSVFVVELPRANTASQD